MYTLKINTNKWYIKFYMFLHNINKKQLPNNSCTLRNELIKTFFIFLITAPLWLLISTIKKNANDYDKIKSYQILGISLFLNLLSVTFLTKSETNLLMFTDFAPYIIYFAPSIVVLSTILIILLIAGILYFPYKYIENEEMKKFKKVNFKKAKKEKTDGVIKKLYKSWRDKNCQKIEWL